MATADFAGVVTSLAVPVQIDGEQVTCFAFGIPEPTTKPTDWKTGTAVFYVGLTGPLSMKVAWVQLQK